MTWNAVSNSLGAARGWQQPGVKRPDNVVPFEAHRIREDQCGFHQLPVDETPGWRDG